MSEETQTIVQDQQKKNLKSILINNKKIFIVILILLLSSLFLYFFYIENKKNIKAEISEQYNTSIIGYGKNPDLTISEMKKIINIKDSTYSPLALYFLLDNDLIDNKNEINEYFDLLINDTKLEDEIKELIIYKKGLYNANTATEDELLSILNPLIKSENLWKSHSIFLIAEYFYSKDEKQKSKEFFEKIIEMENSNPQIKIEAQKRLQRDFSV
tara:strand:- start:1044 stop:1685 length:642 start_codon:yes stop_codon:yes gene_type:complete